MERSTTELTGRLAEYARLTEQVQAIRDGVDEIRGTAYSDDGLVTAVVGGRGELVRAGAGPDGSTATQNATELAARIVAAVHEAAAEDAEQEATKFARSSCRRTAPARHRPDVRPGPAHARDDQLAGGRP